MPSVVSWLLLVAWAVGGSHGADTASRQLRAMATTQADLDAFHRGDLVRIKYRNSALYVDAKDPNAIRMLALNATSMDQAFVVNRITRQWRRARDITDMASGVDLCFLGETIGPCFSNPDRIFVYTPDMGTLASGFYTYCIGGAVYGVPFVKSTDCDAWSPFQQFDLVAAPPLPDDLLLTSGVEVMLRVAAKPTLCVDAARRTTSNEVTLGPCDAANINQIFVYRPSTNALFLKYKSTCLTSTAPSSTGAPRPSVRESACTGGVQQQFRYNTYSKLLRGLYDSNACIDTGGMAQQPRAC